MESELKKYTTSKEQIDLLKTRGLQINDEEYAQYSLEHYNYYRLGGYALTLQRNDIYNKGITFENIMEIYNCDCELRETLFSFIESIEISFRTHLAQILGALGEEEYANPMLYPNPPDWFKIDEIISNAKVDARDEIFIQHHEEKYDGHLPAWVFVEIISFGNASSIYYNMEVELQKELAKRYYPSIRFNYVRRMIKGLVVIRNICAHRGRLFNRGLRSYFPFERNEFKYFESQGYNRDDIGKSLFFAFVAIVKLHPCEQVAAHLIEQIDKTFKRYPFVDISFYGFKPNWKEVLTTINLRYSK